MNRDTERSRLKDIMIYGSKTSKEDELRKEVREVDVLPWALFSISLDN